MSIFFDIFEKYGWIGIIGLFVCMIIFILLRKFGNKLNTEISTGLEKIGTDLTNQMSKQNEQLISTIVTQQDKLVDYLINKENKDNENHNNMLEARMISASEINDQLKDIMNIHNAQRAFILEFHNTSQNFSGIPFAKYSCNYEWFDKGLIPLSNRCMGIAFSSIAKVVTDVIKSPTQQVIYNDMEKFEEENPVLMSIIKNDNTKSIVYTGMYNKNNLIMGLLVLEYQNEVKMDNINLHQLHIQTAELTSVLNIRYKYTK